MGRKDWTDDKLISRLTNNKSNKSRWDHIQVLRSRPSEELFTRCIELTKSKEQKSRIIGIGILAQLGLPPRPFLKQTLKRYFDLLSIENDTEVLMTILYAIGHNNDKLSKEQIKKICSFSNSDNNLVREGLVFALLGINNLTAIETLIKLSSDKISEIRNWATFGIGTQVERNNQNIRAALWDRVNDKHQETKLEAIIGLAKRKDSRVKELIKQKLIDGEYGTLLFEAIVETEDKEFLPLLRQNLKVIQKDTTIIPEWKKDLKNCINELTKRTKERRTTL